MCKALLAFVWPWFLFFCSRHTELFEIILVKAVICKILFFSVNLQTFGALPRRFSSVSLYSRCGPVTLFFFGFSYDLKKQMDVILRRCLISTSEAEYSRRATVLMRQFIQRTEKQKTVRAEISSSCLVLLVLFSTPASPFHLFPVCLSFRLSSTTRCRFSTNLGFSFSMFAFLLPVFVPLFLFVLSKKASQIDPAVLGLLTAPEFKLMLKSGEAFCELTSQLRSSLLVTFGLVTFKL